MIASRRVSSNMMERPIRGRTRYLLLRTVAQCASVFRPFPDPIGVSCTAGRKRSEVLELRHRARDGAVLADGEAPLHVHLIPSERYTRDRSKRWNQKRLPAPPLGR